MCPVYSESFNFLETSGPLQASNGTALPFTFYSGSRFALGDGIACLTSLRAGQSAIRIPTVVGGTSLVRHVQMSCDVHPAFYLIGFRVPPRGKAAEI